MGTACGLATRMATSPPGTVSLLATTATLTCVLARCSLSLSRFMFQSRRVRDLGLQARSTAIRSLTWMHNGNLAVTTDDSGMVHVWKASMSKLHDRKLTDNPIRSLRCACASCDALRMVVILPCGVSGPLVALSLARDGVLLSLCLCERSFSPDDLKFASGGDDGKVRVHDFWGGTQDVEFKGARLCHGRGVRFAAPRLLHAVSVLLLRLRFAAACGTSR